MAGDLKPYLIRIQEITEIGYIVHATDPGDAMERYGLEAVPIGEAPKLNIKVEQITEEVYDEYMRIAQHDESLRKEADE